MSIRKDKYEHERWCYEKARTAVKGSDATIIAHVISLSDNPYQVFKAIAVAEGEIYKAPLRYRLDVWKRERRLLPVRAYA